MDSRTFTRVPDFMPILCTHTGFYWPVSGARGVRAAISSRAEEDGGGIEEQLRSAPPELS